MIRVSFFIDGFNLYHSMVGNQLSPALKWLDLSALCRRFLRHNENLADILYFTAVPQWDTAKKIRHETYIRALRTVNVTIHKGHFNPKTRRIYVNSRLSLVQKTHEEKRSDVALGVELVKQAFEDRYDTAVVVSADGDMAPAIEAVKSRFNEKSIRALFPFSRSSSHLARIVDSRDDMIVSDLKSSLFSDAIPLPSGRILTKPREWS